MLIIVDNLEKWDDDTLHRMSQESVRATSLTGPALIYSNPTPHVAPPPRTLLPCPQSSAEVVTVGESVVPGDTEPGNDDDQVQYCHNHFLMTIVRAQNLKEREIPEVQEQGFGGRLSTRLR